MAGVNPYPDVPPDELWIVLRSGVLVRTGCDLAFSSCKECHLEEGAILQQVEYMAGRLSYRKLSGAGPNAGWISVRHKGKPQACLWIQLYPQRPEPPAWKAPACQFQHSNATMFPARVAALERVTEHMQRKAEHEAMERLMQEKKEREQQARLEQQERERRDLQARAQEKKKQEELQQAEEKRRKREEDEAKKQADKRKRDAEEKERNEAERQRWESEKFQEEKNRLEIEEKAERKAAEAKHLQEESLSGDPEEWCGLKLPTSRGKFVPEGTGRPQLPSWNPRLPELPLGKVQKAFPWKEVFKPLSPTEFFNQVGPALTAGPVGYFYNRKFPYNLTMIQEMGCDWLTTALHAAGTLPKDNAVVSLDAKEFVGGGACLKAILTVQYKIPQLELHERLFAKYPFPFTGENLMAMWQWVCVMNNDGPEIDFARMLSAGAPMRCAKYYFGDLCPKSGVYILVTECLNLPPDGADFGPHELEPIPRKSVDYLLDDPFSYYDAIVRNAAKLAAWGVNGKLGKDVLHNFPPPELSSMLAMGVKGKIPKFIKFARDVAPQMFEPGMVNEEFEMSLYDTLLDVEKRQKDIFNYLYGNDMNLVGLTHQNMNIDNAFFWRREDGTIESGFIDWGRFRQENYSTGLLFGLSNTDLTDFLVDCDPQLLRNFCEEYAKDHRAGLISFEKLWEHYMLNWAVQSLWIVQIPDANIYTSWEHTRAERWSTIKDYKDPRIFNMPNCNNGWVAQIRQFAWQWKYKDIPGFWASWREAHPSQVPGPAAKPKAKAAGGSPERWKQSPRPWSNIQTVYLGKTVPDWCAGLESHNAVSVAAAVAQLNTNSLLCDEGVCIVHSAGSRGYFLLYRTDKEAEVTASGFNVSPAFIVARTPKELVEPHPPTAVGGPNTQTHPAGKTDQPTIPRHLRPASTLAPPFKPCPYVSPFQKVLQLKKLKERASKRLLGELYGLPFPATPEELESDTFGAEWLTKAFHRVGSLPEGNSVRRIVSLRRFEGGGSGPKALFVVEYENSDEALDARLFMKCPHPLWENEQQRYREEGLGKFGDNWGGEIAFYRFLSPHTPFPVPKLYFADLNRESTEACVITYAMEWPDKNKTDFGPYELLPPCGKCEDFVLKDPHEFYFAVLRRLGTFAGLAKAKKLGPDLEKMSWYDPNPRTDIFCTTALPEVEKSTRTFIEVVAPHLWPKHVHKKAFLDNLERNMVRANRMAPAIAAYVYSIPRYVGLHHQNGNTDNAFFYRREDGVLDCGIFDWGSTAHMAYACAFQGTFISGLGEMVAEYDDRLIRAWADAYTEAGGPELDFEELLFQYRLVTCVSAYNNCTVTRQWGQVQNAGFWAAVKAWNDPVYSDAFDWRFSMGMLYSRLVLLSLHGSAYWAALEEAERRGLAS